MKTILVAGGAGFIGYHLSRYLLNEGYEVICLDNLYTGQKENVIELEKFDNFTFIQHNIINPIEIKADEIYNLACPASPVHYQADPIFTTKTSVIGCLNLLDLALKNNAKFLFTSTSEVYGDPIDHPQRENYRGNVNPIGIRSCYDEGKRCAESLIFDYYRIHKLKIKVARIFNTYGPNMSKNDGRVVSSFIQSCLKNESLLVFGDGKQTRCFCYVSDMVKGLVKLMDSDNSITGPINIGSDNEMTVLELANKVKYIFNSNSMIKFKNLPADDPKIRQPDISAALKYLSWTPKVDIDSGLNLTIDYFRKNN